MKFLRVATAIASFLPATCARKQVDTRQDAETPVKWGLMAFPGVDLLDLYGPLEILYFVAANRYLNVKIITPTADNILIVPPMGNNFNSTYQPEVVGTATLDDDLDLDFLLVPGGAAARDPALTYVDEYIVKMMPKIKYLVTVCTGALFAARGGVLDNRRATTNKNAWDLVTQHGTNVSWVAPARWVRDGNIWSSSGGSSGMDVTFAIVKEFYGEELHDRISIFTEVVPRVEGDDPFTDIVGVEHQGN